MGERKSMVLKVDDIVGISLPKYNKKTGELVGSVIAVKGQITRIYRPTPTSNYRAEIFWENRGLGFLYTGRTDWAYLTELTLVRRNGFDRGNIPGRYT